MLESSCIPFCWISKRNKLDNGNLWVPMLFKPISFKSASLWISLMLHVSYPIWSFTATRNTSHPWSRQSVIDSLHNTSNYTPILPIWLTGSLDSKHVWILWHIRAAIIQITYFSSCKRKNLEMGDAELCSSQPDAHMSLLTRNNDCLQFNQMFSMSQPKVLEEWLMDKIWHFEKLTYLERVSGHRVIILQEKYNRVCVDFYWRLLFWIIFICHSEIKWN